jgi:hypothetical protein
LNKIAVGIAVIVLIGITLGSLIYYNPSLFNIQPNSVINVSQLYVDPQGSETSSGTLTGCYWNLLFNVESQNVLQGVKLPSGKGSNIAI